MVGDSPVFIDTDDNFTIKSTAFRWSEGLWKLLTRNNMCGSYQYGRSKDVYKLFVMTNAHLNRYQPGDNINIKRRKNFVISLRLSLRKRTDGVSNQRYVLNG